MKPLLIHQSLPPDDTLPIIEALRDLALGGNVEALKALQDLQAQDVFDTLVNNCDDDEYEFA